MLCIGRDKRHRVSDATTAEVKKLKTIQPNPRMVQSLALSLLLHRPFSTRQCQSQQSILLHPSAYMQPAHDAFRIIINVVNIINQTLSGVRLQPRKETPIVWYLSSPHHHYSDRLITKTATSTPRLGSVPTSYGLFSTSLRSFCQSSVADGGRST
jgi:hypothetical protein